MKVKIFLLISLMTLMCGCESWDDIYSEYKDVLDKGISCTYNLVGNSEPATGLKEISLRGNKDGIYVSYNGGEKNLLINSKDEYESFHEINGYYNYYNNFDYNRFLDEYSKTNTCPSNIYYYVSSEYYIDDSCPSDQTCYVYSTSASSGNNQSSDGTDNKCHIASAIECRTYDKELDGKTFYMELGYEKLSDGSVGRYFKVTDQSSFEGGIVTRDSNGLVTVFNGSSFQIENPEKIYSTDGSNYTFSEIKVNKNVSFGMTYYYIYSASDDDAVLGDYEEGTAGEYNPGAVDEPTGAMEDLEIEEINFCEQNGVRKTFQIVGYILYVAKLVVPLLLIILGTVDFAKATISSDDKAPKEAVVSLIKRILIAIIIFLIPTILNFLLSLVNGASEAFSDSEFTDCTDCLFDPFGDCKAEDIGSTNG